ncbi:MAG: hypothetical protein AAGA80_04775 [Cyanobacteria bacterium P01_F01_bin.143]
MSTSEKKNNKFGFLGSDFSSSEEAKTSQKEKLSTSEPAKTNASVKPKIVEAKIDNISDQKTKKTSKKTTTNQQKSTESKTTTAKVSSTTTKTVTKEENSNLGKRSDPNYKTVGVLLPQKAHKKAKILLMDDQQGRDFSDLMTELLEGWLKEQSS